MDRGSDMERSQEPGKALEVEQLALLMDGGKIPRPEVPEVPEQGISSAGLWGHSWTLWGQPTEGEHGWRAGRPELRLSGPSSESGAY